MAGHGSSDSDLREKQEIAAGRSSPEARPGTLEHDVWQSIFALEDALTDERRKTTLLARKRKISRDGELDNVADFVRKPPSEGYRMLVERGRPELTFEAVALRHADRFHADVLQAAEDRLRAPGVQKLQSKLEGTGWN
jgi:hypothetical protein